MKGLLSEALNHKFKTMGIFMGPEPRRIGLDLKNHAFQARGAEKNCAVIFSQQTATPTGSPFLSCMVDMEARAGHYRGEIGKLGDSIKLTAPACVKPFVNRQENGASDA